MSRHYIAIAALAACLIVIEASAHAGGLQLATRGVRPTARGGAFIAGAEGLSSFGFNPAGVAKLAREERPYSALLDFGFVHQSAEYTRIDSGGNPQAPVSNEAPGLPIPTIAGSMQLGDDAALALGIYAPYAGLGKYPEAGPQRYSLVDLSQSLLVISELALGYNLLDDRLRLGVGLQNMVFSMDSTVAFSACPGETICAPEDPEFDAVGRVSQLSLFNPSAVAGVQFDIIDQVRVGAALQLPFFIGGSGQIQTRLPSSGFFEGAEVRGDVAEVSFTLPAALRFGVELTPLPRWAIELAVQREFWSQHDAFVIQPKGVRIEDAAGVGTYEVGELRIPRNFEDTWAVNLGVEGQPLEALPLSVLAGYSFETAAAPDSYLSVLTVDGAKHMLAAGAGYQLGAWKIDAALAYAAVGDREVTPDEGRSPQLNPIRDESDEPLEVYVNWGEYSSFWLVVGAGLSRSF
ncbi:OmpP1/FadL family transporter [Haliangium ochraceum]|uniref:Membrane protein involved in aromatic hydrocarbon degradation n=1 Tax=Haliangium ochraceum (strain DSM 14365 / JCM 11303 / SMP-2) TaxID=502025 RepID=D0LWC3_HALO1|nr:outer membrane protein transport protein [Haliangium ochraceum]ACY16055.1 membrane protein involved in aromatic hydrocarbon degradation [Haliangium ochraceum DSM 14365]